MSLDIICLCAEWCGTCREFRAAFEDAATQDAAHRFHWLDIEEHEDALGDIEISDFPMIVIADAQGAVCFAGPILPHAGTLRRLCDAALADGLRATDQQPWAGVVLRLRATGQ